MSIHVQHLSLGGETVRLLMVRPNWATSPRLTCRMGTEVTEGVTGREHRRAQQVSPRLTLTYEAILTGAEAQTLRDFFGQMDSGRVAMPLWPDLRGTSDWADRLFEGTHSLGWSDGFSSVNTTPAGEFRSPLLVGRLERPELTALDGQTVRVRLTLREDGDYPVSPRATAPASWDAGGWSPNWRTEPRELTRDLLRYEPIGRGRSQQVEGTAAIRYRQTAGFTLQRPALRTLLAYWWTRGGSREAFSAPAWLQPGVALANAPHTFDPASATGRVRFAGELTCEFPAPDIAELEVSLDQVYDDEHTLAGPRQPYAFCYTLQRGTAVTRLTDWEAEVTTASAGTFSPGRIEHSGLVMSLHPSEDRVRLIASVDDAPVLLRLAQGEHEEPIEVTIHEADLSTAPATTRVLWRGRIRRPKFAQNTMEAEVTWLGNLLSRRTPAHNFSLLCNYPFLSAGCARRRPGWMDEDNLETTGTLHPHPVANGVILRSVSHPTLHDDVTVLPSAEDYFSGGWFRCSSGVTKQTRTVIRSLWNGSDLVLFLDRALIWADLTAGQPGYVIPGCDGSYSTCKAKFANGVSFGGFPQMPSTLYLQSASQPAPGGGGK